MNTGFWLVVRSLAPLPSEPRACGAEASVGDRARFWEFRTEEIRSLGPWVAGLRDKADAAAFSTPVSTYIGPRWPAWRRALLGGSAGPSKILATSREPLGSKAGVGSAE